MTSFACILRKFSANIYWPDSPDWLFHISALAPEYAKAAGILAEKDSPIKLGKVDATEESSLGEKFEVRGYPTLKLFSNGQEVEDYKGGRTKKDMVAYITEKAKAIRNELWSNKLLWGASDNPWRILSANTCYTFPIVAYDDG